jgi:hypothetical protein
MNWPSRPEIQVPRMKPRGLSHTQTARVGMHDLMLLTRKARRERIDIMLLAIGLDWMG